MPKTKLIIGKDRLLIYEGIIFWLWKRKDWTVTLVYTPTVLVKGYHS